MIGNLLVRKYLITKLEELRQKLGKDAVYKKIPKYEHENIYKHILAEWVTDIYLEDILEDEEIDYEKDYKKEYDKKYKSIIYEDYAEKYSLETILDEYLENISKLKYKNVIKNLIRTCYEVEINIKNFGLFDFKWFLTEKPFINMPIIERFDRYLIFKKTQDVSYEIIDDSIYITYRIYKHLKNKYNFVNSKESNLKLLDKELHETYESLVNGTHRIFSSIGYLLDYDIIVNKKDLLSYVYYVEKEEPEHEYDPYIIDHILKLDKEVYKLIFKSYLTFKDDRAFGAFRNVFKNILPTKCFNKFSKLLIQHYSEYKKAELKEIEEK